MKTKIVSHACPDHEIFWWRIMGTLPYRLDSSKVKISLIADFLRHWVFTANLRKSLLEYFIERLAMFRSDIFPVIEQIYIPLGNSGCSQRAPGRQIPGRGYRPGAGRQGRLGGAPQLSRSHIRRGQLFSQAGSFFHSMYKEL